MGTTARKIVSWLSRREAIRANRVGGETPDPTPVHVPGMNNKPLTLREEMQRYVRQELSAHAQDTGAGSFTEEDDFTEENPDVDLLSPYTVSELAPESEMPQSDLDGAPTDEDRTAALTDTETADEAVPPAQTASGGEATASPTPPD